VSYANHRRTTSRPEPSHNWLRFREPLSGSDEHLSHPRPRGDARFPTDIRYAVSKLEVERLALGFNSDPLLQIAGLIKTYVQGRWREKQFYLKALDGVDLTLEAEKTLALVGKSGAGKTTLAMCTALLDFPTPGRSASMDATFCPSTRLSAYSFGSEFRSCEVHLAPT
jgi:ABC-type glutathione transport system ATPase component